MLNFFLVLGLVPGTNLVLTFNEIMLAIFLLAAFIYLRAGHQPRIFIKQEVVQLSRLHSFSFPIPNQPAPAVSIPRKAAALQVNIFAQRLAQAARRFRLSV